MIDTPSILDFMREQAYRPMTIEELSEAFSVTDERENEALGALVSAMEADGRIVRTRTLRYGVPERMDLVVGRLEVKARGFGFVVSERVETPDLYISATDMAGAMDGDHVIARPKKVLGGVSREGEIIRVLTRARHVVVGQLRTLGGYGFVQPDDKHLHQDVFIPGESLQEAVDGQKVVIEIVDYPDRGSQSATGAVKEILGFPDDPGVDILAIVRKYGIPELFPQAVLQAAEDVPHQVADEEIRNRRDLRDEVIVTIDGADAKDLDDAVHVKRLANGNYLLGVHIADVSYYVREGALLDQEANRRGTSVYLVDRVIPMLPPRLSNGICSLNPRVDRLTLTCEMEWSQDFALVRHDIYPSVIRTTERMTYDEVRGILSGTNEAAMTRYAPLVEFFFLMEQLALGLRKRRIERGAVDFDFAETKVKVDEEGRPLEIVRRERSIAEMIIEEFMLAANETVAEHFHWLEAPFLYRVHEAPTAERMKALNDFVHNFGYHLKAAGHIHPRALQDLLERVRGEKEELVISYVMLRSMKQARYAAESLGHFGLAAKYYSHFTSPIRRYPDLVVHRVIREMLVEGNWTETRKSHLLAIMPDVAAHCSDRERNAVDAERETDLIKKIEYMMDKVGEEFAGMISGVTGFGLFVQLDNSVEGLIHVSYLSDDYYHYHENLHALIGERLKHTYRIGDRVRVVVLAASKEQLAIDFGLVEKLEEDDPAILEQAGAEARGRQRKGWTGDRGEQRSARTKDKGKNKGRVRKGVEASVWAAPTPDDSGRKRKSRPAAQVNESVNPRSHAKKQKNVAGVDANGLSAESQRGTARDLATPSSVIAPMDADARTKPKKRPRRKKSALDQGEVTLTTVLETANGGKKPVQGEPMEHPARAGARKRMKSGAGDNPVAQPTLLRSKGGYADGAAWTADAGGRKSKRAHKDKQALKAIGQTYGVQVKDKAKRQEKKQHKADQASPTDQRS